MKAKIKEMLKISPFSYEVYHVPQIVQPTSVVLSLVQLLASVFSINLLLRKASPLQVIQNSAPSVNVTSKYSHMDRGQYLLFITHSSHCVSESENF